MTEPNLNETALRTKVTRTGSPAWLRRPPAGCAAPREAERWPGLARAGLPAQVLQHQAPVGQQVSCRGGQRTPGWLKPSESAAQGLTPHGEWLRAWQAARKVGGASPALCPPVCPPRQMRSALKPTSWAGGWGVWIWGHLKTSLAPKNH